MEDVLGIVPPHIRAKYENEEAVEREVRGSRELNRRLRDAFGPDVEVCRVGPRAEPSNFSGNIVPGFWHVRVHGAPPAVPHYTPITTPEGGYREPSARIFGELANIDLRRPEVKARVLAQTRTDQPLRAAERALKAEQRVDEGKHNFEAAKRVRGEGGLRKSYERKRSMK